MLTRPRFCSLSLPPTNCLENEQIFFLCSSISQRFVLQVGTENLLLAGRQQREACCGEARLRMGFLLPLPPLWCLLLCASQAALCSWAFHAGACWGRGIFRSQMGTVGKQSDQSIWELGESTRSYIRVTAAGRGSSWLRKQALPWFKGSICGLMLWIPWFNSGPAVVCCRRMLLTLGEVMLLPSHGYNEIDQQF